MTPEDASTTMTVEAPPPGVTRQRAKLLANLVSMFGSEMLGKALLLVFFFIVADLLPKEEMGTFSFCAAMTAFLPIVAGLGLRQIVIRETAHDRQQCRRFLETVIWQRLVSIAAGLMVLLALTFLISKFQPMRLELMIAGVSVSMLLLTDLGTAVCEGVEHMHWIPLINAVEGGSRIMSLGLVLFLPAKAWVVLSLICASQIVTAAVSLHCAGRLLGGFPRPHRHPHTLGYAIRQGLPLAFLGLAQRSYARFDWIFVGMVKNTDILAPYSVGYRIYEGLNLLGPGVLRATFPRLTQSVAGAQEVFIERVVLLVKAMILVNTLIVSAAILHVGNVLDFFGDKYDDGAKPAMVLLCGLPFLAVFGTLYHAFLAQRRQKIMLFNGVLIAVINILINLGAVPVWGTMGAAVATALPYAIGMVVAWIIFRRTVGPLPIKWAYFRCVAPAVPTLLAGRWLPMEWSVLGLIPGWIFIGLAQGLIFIVTAFLLHPWRLRDQRRRGNVHG